MTSLGCERSLALRSSEPPDRAGGSEPLAACCEACVLLAAVAFHAAVAATAGARLLREDRPCSGCAWKRTPDALFPPAPALPETPPKLGCWSAPSLLAGERPRAALTCEGYAEPNTPACVLSLAVACVRLFAAPVEAGYVTSSALLSRPPSQAPVQDSPPAIEFIDEIARR